MQKDLSACKFGPKHADSTTAEHADSAFSKAQVSELELAVDARSMSKLLDFLRHSFGGGTDVDRPLELSLQRLESQGWEQVC